MTTSTTDRPPRAKRVSEATAARDEGVAQVEAHADPRVILSIDAHIQKAIDSGERFSANDIRDAFPVSNEHLVGARFLSFAGRRVDGHPLMKKVDTEPSSLESTHRHDIAIWLGWAAYRAQQDDALATANAAPTSRRATSGTDSNEQDTFALLDGTPS